MALVYSRRRAVNTGVFPHWRKRASSADRAAIAGVAMMVLLFACALAAVFVFLNA